MPNFEIERETLAKQIKDRLRRIERTIFTHRQRITGVRACPVGKNRGPEAPPSTGWEPFEVPGFWGGFDETTWFEVGTRIPKEMKGYRVVALLRPGGESLAYVNGEPRHGLDRKRDLVILTEKAEGGEKFIIHLESVPSCQHDLKQAFEYADLAVMHPEVWNAYWDLRVALEVYRGIPEDSAVRRKLLEAIREGALAVDMNAGERGQVHISQPWIGIIPPDLPAYLASLRKARGLLRRSLVEFQQSGDMGDLTLVGHSHLDTAWLWPIRETKRKVGRTFSNVLDLMDRYPEFRFSCSQPAQYAYCEAHHPALYERIRQRVKEGRWEPNGCFWVEPDLNVPSGESLVRQAVYGNRFFREQFGVHSRVAWLPDTFGFCAALPQILKRAQVDYFTTTKLNWSRYTEFPYSLFRWEALDGSRVMAACHRFCNGDVNAREITEEWNRFKQKERMSRFFFAFGWGDGGGGPTAEMLENGLRLADLPGVPRCTFGAIEPCLEQMAKECAPEELPIWHGELFFELHRGCQTTQARTKRNNRDCEWLLRNTEFLSSMGQVNGGSYEHEVIVAAWKRVLTNQFHDIIPGTSVNEVYREADQAYAEVRREVSGVADRALDHLMEQVDTSGAERTMVVVNTLSWARGGTVVLPNNQLPKGAVHVVDCQNRLQPSQRLADGSLLVDVQEAPSMGYAVFHLMEEAEPEQAALMLKVSEKGLENEYLRIRLDRNGALSSVYDKEARREVLPKGSKGNNLQLFEDRPCEWEAWDIDYNFEEKSWTLGKPVSLEVIEAGPVRATVRIVYKTESSTITQDVCLGARSRRVDFVTYVDWWEKRALLKAAFPIDVRSSFATYEVQYGAVERPTHRNRPEDAARFEVPAQKWADLSEGNYGAAVLNNCKYGYDAKENVVRLSLLRSTVDPDNHADEGEHRFTYALFPHRGDWRHGVVREAYELNVPLLAIPAAPSPGPLPGVLSFIQVDADHVVVDAVKRCEDSDAIVVRLYEAHGRRGEVSLFFDREVARVVECDLMEENEEPVESEGSQTALFIEPYQIRTFKVLY